MASGCGDVLSLQDLKTAKLHQTFEAEVITGHAGGLASGALIDYATNLATGQVQKTMPAILRDIGFEPAAFDFASGGTLTVNDRSTVVQWTIASGGDGNWYNWQGSLPKVIPASSTPNSTGGVGTGAWVPMVLGSGGFPSRLTVANSTIPASVSLIELKGFASEGDGGESVYRRVNTEPAHPGKIQSQDGAWWEFAGQEVNLYQMGCKGDSTSGTPGSGTDNTAAFGNARDVAFSRGIPLVVPGLPPGKAFRLGSRITFTNTLTIRGTGAQVTEGLTANTPKGGSWLYFDHSDHGFYFRDDAAIGASKKFARISGIGIDRNQSAPAAGWLPSAAVADIRVEFNVDLDAVFFLKSSRCALIRSGGQLQTSRIRGQALVVGFECERSADVQRWDGDHWWPYWTQDTNVITYTKQNAYCYSIRRADGLMIDNAFGIFYKRVLFASDAAGDGSGMANFHLRNMYADIGGGGIEINSNFYSAYGSIEGYLCNSDVGGNGTDGAALRVAGVVPSKIKVSMRSNRSPAEVVYVSGSAHKITLNLTYANGWAFVTSGSYALKATDGAIIENLNTPDLSTGNNLLYNKDSQSSILFKASYDLTDSLTSPRGFHSRRVSIVDDGVAVIAAPSANATVLMNISPSSVPAAGNPAGQVWLRATSSPSSLSVSLTPTANVAVVTGVLTGTTGTDGNLTISAGPDGNYYIENRTGLQRAFDITLLGS